jgi:hypothetical protein
MSSQNLQPLPDVLSRIKRGLAGYVSYLAACEMNEALSEYALYEPTLRILTARHYFAKCECPCPGFDGPRRGDHKRLDFVVRAPATGIHFAMELKWARKNRINVVADVEKLKRFRAANPGALGILCVFGRKSFLDALILNPAGLHERGKAIYADLGRTKYGCRIYEVRDDL